jgi:hypothetical protein
VLSDGQLRALGELAYYCAQLKHVIEVLLYDLIDEDPQVGAALFGSLGFDQRMQRVQALIPIRGEHELFPPSLKDHLVAAREVMQMRNALMHSRWVRMSTGETIQARGKTVANRTRMEVTEEEDLLQAAKSAKHVSHALEIDWAGLMITLGRTEPIDSSSTHVYVPNRWDVEGDVTPSPSRTKTDLVRCMEGSITREEYLRRTGGKLVGDA